MLTNVLVNLSIRKRDNASFLNFAMPEESKLGGIAES